MYGTLVGNLSTFIAALADSTDHSYSMNQAVDPELQKVINQIASLLAKAENSEFPAEAEAFEEKASAKMARYNIDRAMLLASAPEVEEIISSTVSVPSGPYVRPRTSLLAKIATALGCEIVYWSSWESRQVNILGFASDVHQTEAYYTQLLAQMADAVKAEKVPNGTAAVSFRRSFMVGFAQTAGSRLQKHVKESAEQAQKELDDARANDEKVFSRNAAPGLNDDALPVTVAMVLAGKSERVADEFKKRHPRVRSARPPSAVVRNGFLAGQSAGEKASFGSSESISAPKAALYA
jgi:hypothetical protein